MSSVFVMSVIMGSLLDVVDALVDMNLLVELDSSLDVMAVSSSELYSYEKLKLSVGKSDSAIVADISE